MVRTRTNPSHLSSALLPSRLFPSCQSSERSFIFIPNKYPSILVLMKTFTDFNLSKLFNKKTNKIPIYMGVSKNGGTPKWMVYNGKPYYNGMIWGYHHFRKHPHVQAIFDLWLSLTKWFPRLNSPRVEETRPHNQPAAIVSLRRSNGTRPMKLKHTKKVRLQKTKCLSLKKYLSKKYKKVKCLERSKVNMTCLLNHDFLTFFLGKKSGRKDLRVVKTVWYFGSWLWRTTEPVGCSWWECCQRWLRHGSWPSRIWWGWCFFSPKKWNLTIEQGMGIMHGRWEYFLVILIFSKNETYTTWKVDGATSHVFGLS